jgi:hypothetical protein
MKNQKRGLTQKEIKAKMARVVKEFELFRGNTISRLWQWAYLEETCPYPKEQAERALVDVGEEIRRLRYELDVARAGLRRLQAENEMLRQTSFKF